LTRRFAVLACLTGTFFAGGSPAAELQKSIRAIHTETAPVIDGRLDDPVWRQAAVIEDLHEVTPIEYEKAAEPSRFYVLYDRDALYVGVRLWESDLGNISAQVLRKGDFSFGDDSVSVFIDPHNNRRSGYIFDLTPNGVRNEALISDVTTENWDWQGIWHAAASRDEQGWIAEFEIPFKTLSFDSGNDTWGFNLSRWRARSGEYYGWVSRNRAVNPANSGELEGLIGADQGLGLDVVPGIRVRDSRNHESSYSTTDVDPSIDVFYKLTPALTAALTANTDFSGTGADARQINLSRFGLFFPERRDFFLQDTNIFEFGLIGAGSPWGVASTLDSVELQSGRPFFSRRIGLSDSGEAIDLHVGGKLTGQIGDWDIGIIDIRQADHTDVDSTNLLVARVARHVLAESSIGAIVTHGDPLTDHDNALVGLDFRYLNNRLSNGRSLAAAVWYQQTDTTGLDGDDAAFGAMLKLPTTEGFRGAAGFREFQRNYNPALGFVNRVDVRDYMLELGYVWVVDSEKIRAVHSGVDAQRVDTIAGQLQSRMINFRALEIESPSADKLNLHYAFFKEQLDDPFEISEGIIIPAGLYSFDQYCVWTESGTHRRIAAGIGHCGGDFYDGDIVNVHTELTWRPNAHFRFVLGYELNDIELPQGDFITRLASLRADIAFTTTWSWENFIQYDNVSDSLGLNSILRWLPRAGREMVFVINREFRDYAETRSFESFSSDVAFKFSYTFRF
jgi:hypothetical protein